MRKVVVSAEPMARTWKVERMTGLATGPDAVERAVIAGGLGNSGSLPTELAATAGGSANSASRSRHSPRAFIVALVAFIAGAAAPQSPPPQSSSRNVANLPSALPDPAPPTAAGAGMTAGVPEVPLFPGQAVQPIDLASTLRMAGARDLDIATARQRVLRSLADLQEAHGLWLPSFFTGPTFYSLSGQVQAINGQIQTVHRDSLSLGTTATLANSFPAPPPGAATPL